jgi:hypothetical protein
VNAQPVIPQPVRVETVTIERESPETFDEILAESDNVSPGLQARAPAKDLGAGAEAGELARARAIAQRLGITNLTDDEYDVPTYMRRRGAENEL